MAPTLEASSRSSESAGIERRTAVRFACTRQTEGRLRLGGGDVSWPARMRDVSTGGVALLVYRPFEPGTVLTLEIPSAGGPARQLVLRVVHVKPRSRSEWLIGCALPAPLTDEEVQALI